MRLKDTIRKMTLTASLCNPGEEEISIAGDRDTIMEILNFIRQDRDVPKAPPLTRKPFDLEAAKAGKPMVTRDGKEAVFIAHVPEAMKWCHVIVRVGDTIYTFGIDGKVATNSELNLFMLAQKKTVFVNLYRTVTADILHGCRYETEADARDGAGIAAIAIANPVEIDA